MSNTQTTQITFPTHILFFIFLVLKLTGYIDWSWVWVTAPLWIPLAVAGICFAIAALLKIGQ